MPAISAGVSTSRPTASPGTGKELVRNEIERLGSVGVLAEDEVVPQAGVGRGVAPDRRDVARLLAEQALVRVAEERDDVVAAGENDVPQPRIRRAVRVDDALDLLGDQVLCERAGRVARRLLLQGRDARVARDVDDDTVDLGPGGEGRRACSRACRRPAASCRARAFEESVRITVASPVPGAAARERDRRVGHAGAGRHALRHGDTVN